MNNMQTLYNRKTSQIVITGIILSLVLSWFPFKAKGAEPIVLEPYANIARMASGRSAYKFVERLTREDMAGRQSGTEGCDKAAIWIAEHSYANLFLATGDMSPVAIFKTYET